MTLTNSITTYLNDLNAHNESKFSTFKVTYNKKYARIERHNGDNDNHAGAYAFIVLATDDKLNEGDILKPASWSSPVKTYIRGNTIACDYDASKIYGV